MNKLNVTLKFNNNETLKIESKNISNKKRDIVFLLWGGFARKKIKLIDESKHYILEAGHPSPLSANRGYWFGNKHFLKTNEHLKSKKITEIKET